MYAYRKLWMSCVVVLMLAGCATTGDYTQFQAKNVDFETAWLATIEAVSDLGNICEANKAEGRVVATQGKTWERDQITVQIVSCDGACQVKVQAEKQKKASYLRPGGFLVEETWESVGRDKSLEQKVKDRINEAIKQMLKKPAAD